MQQALKHDVLRVPDVGLAPGIYFWLPEAAYHADPALGSSDIRAMRADLDRWWRGSRFNPNAAERELYARKTTKATEIGKAMHKLVLEGREEFEALYVRRPDDPEGSTGTDKALLTKRAKKELVLDGQTLLKGDEWDLCERTAGLIERHPDLATALVGGMNEVSVFWRRTADGVMCKARFDRLKPNGVGDIKSIENERGHPLERACIDAFLSYRYDMQAEHYLEARAQMRVLVARHKVFMPEAIHEDQSLAANELAFRCAETDYHIRGDNGVEWFHRDRMGYAFQFIFVQKSVPGVFSFVLSPGNGYLDDAHRDIEEAIDSYTEMLREVGPGSAPLPQWRIAELAYEEAPAWWRYRR